MVPAGAALPAGSAVAAGIAVGKAALLPFDGTAVGAGPLLVDGAAVALALGTAVGEVEPLLASGVAVAEDPQANNRATNNRTIALGQCFMIFLPDLDSDILPSPNLRFVMMFPKLQISSPEEIS